jgi:hypothetical protein
MGVWNYYDAKIDYCTGTTEQHFEPMEGRGMKMVKIKGLLSGLYVVMTCALLMSLSTGDARATQSNGKSLSTPVVVMPVSIKDATMTQSRERSQASYGKDQSSSDKKSKTTLTIESLTSTPSEITATESTSVLFTAEIDASKKMIADSVILYQCDADGNSIETLGRLYDDETNGDSASDDDVYSREVTLYGDDVGYFYFKITAAYKNSNSSSKSRSSSIKGVESDLIAVEVIAASVPEDTDETEEYTDTDFETPDWTDETHSKSADPNFDEVFDDTEVKRIDFVITPARWQSMLDDMTNLYGEFGQNTALGDPGIGEGGPIIGDDGLPVLGDDGLPILGDDIILGDDGLPIPPDDGVIPDDGALMPPDEGLGMLEDVDDPIFVPAEVFYNGKEWYRVGIRFKGNSSLQSSWEQGILKLPFKLDFDEFEDYYPQIDNQRFYGFKKFSLKNNYEDKSLIREKIASDVFASAGLAVSHTAFFALYIDHGDGPEYFGLYTLVEEVDDTVIDTQFTSDDGNLYKPEDGSASFIEPFSEDDFEKKTNEDDEDWSDITSLFTALHADLRVSDSATWRANLESVFNVNVFLKYLAVNGIIQNWDSYGRMPHNYYLYNDPDSSTLTWIPWDHNETFKDDGLWESLALDFSNIEVDAWPLIEKIYADSTYKAQYDSYLAEVIGLAFDTVTMHTLYETYATMIEPYATSEREGYSFLIDPSEFYQAIDELKDHATARAAAVEEYLIQ